ncbi:MAG: hypothetical protein C4290_00665 [Chloroflexota bacterium]
MDDSTLRGAGQVGRLLPRAVAEARAAPSLTHPARQRIQMLQWDEDHGRNARLTCRHFGVRPDTFSRWLRRYLQGGVRALEDRSRRPRRVRRQTGSRELALAVLPLREAHPR